MQAMKAFMLVVCLASASSASAQGNPTGGVTGRVTDAGGLSIPGVSVSVTSPQLQGTRTATTSIAGDFLIALLPPGDYTVRFELSGFKTVDHAVKIAGAQTFPLNVRLDVGGIRETITVTVTPAESLTPTATAATTIKQRVIEQLPTNRQIDSTTALAAGVLRSGPSSTSTGLGAISISGAVSSENLFLVNGVVVNENLRGQPLNLYVEDAIQETTVSTSAVSAEFGRFTGGVVNAITKSGGNMFSGSFRTSVDNDSWRSVTPLKEPRTDKTLPTYELTAGGPLLKDRTWFFGAARLTSQKTADVTTATGLAFEREVDQKRYEAKVTEALTPQHTVRGSYLRRLTRTTNDRFTAPILDLASLTSREDPDAMWSLNYNGTVTPRLFVEAQYSRRDSAVKGNGAAFTDLIRGTLLVDNSRGGARYNSPTFCGVCPPEERNNRNFLVKTSYYLSGPHGTHNVAVGFDTFNDIRIADTHQSGSDYRILGTGAIVRGADVYPVFNNDGLSTLIQFNPIPATSRGTDLITRSVFVNDQWRLNGRVTANVGVRFDRNAGRDASDVLVANDSRVSPRLSVSFDPTGESVWSVNGSYAVYVASISNGIGNAGSSAGSNSTYRYAYLGPAINTIDGAPLLTSAQAIQTVFDWFFANGGANRPTTTAAVPGVNTRINGSLASPGVREVAGGLTRTFGGTGLVRVDGVYRTFDNFYAVRVDTTTGQVRNELNQAFDVRLVENTNDVSRQYWGVNTSVSYKANPRLQVGAAYTLSHTFGNVDGENANAGPTTIGPRAYPEYIEASWNLPEGDLAADQRHKARVWSTLTLPTSERWGLVTLGLLESVDSGLPFGAVGTINSSPYVTNPGYVQAPTAVAYYFTSRDAFRTETSSRTDLAVNYAYRLGARRGTELFARADVTNLFNQQALVNPFFLFGTVLTRSNNAAYQAFNPFTTEPVRGVNWDLAPNFFDPSSRFAYQAPRQFRLAFGVRF